MCVWGSAEGEPSGASHSHRSCSQHLWPAVHARGSRGRFAEAVNACVATGCEQIIDDGKAMWLGTQQAANDAMEIPMNSREVPGKQKEVTIMRKYHRFSVSLVLWLFFFAIGSHTAGAQSSLQSIDSPQGGKIVYGLVDGATTQAAAMSKVLRIVHNNCGERPQVGRVFRVRGTDSVAVFFTVVNRPQGNKPVAGVVIAVPSGPNQIEAALVSDDAARFGSSLNPMLNQLFSVWHPGGAAASFRPAAGGHSALAAKLHTVAASDNSVSIGVPDGWTLEPRSSGGTIHRHGSTGTRCCARHEQKRSGPNAPVAA